MAEPNESTVEGTLEAFKVIVASFNPYEITSPWKDRDELRYAIARWLGHKLIQKQDWEESNCDPTRGYRYTYYVLENGNRVPHYHPSEVLEIVSTRFTEEQRKAFFNHLERLMAEKKYRKESAFVLDCQHIEAVCRVMDIGRWDQELTWEI